MAALEAPKRPSIIILAKVNTLAPLQEVTAAVEADTPPRAMDDLLEPGPIKAPESFLAVGSTIMQLFN